MNNNNILRDIAVNEAIKNVSETDKELGSCLKLIRLFIANAQKPAQPK